MPAPDLLPPWPNHTAGRLTEVEAFIATAQPPRTIVEIGATFAGTIEEELHATLKLLATLQRIALIDGRYHWVG